MKTFIGLSLVIAGIFVSRGLVYADHDKSCQNVHGRVTVVTENGVTVGDKMYNVGKSTRITKGNKVLKLENISAGDLVCVDTRGNDDIGGGEVAAVTVLPVGDPPAVAAPFQSREIIRETIREQKYTDHDKSCKNVHGKVTVVTENGVMVGDKMYNVGNSTRITKDNKVVKLENISAGDLVCLDTRGNDDIGGGEVAAVTVLPVGDPPPVAAPFQSREIIRETIREQK